MSEDRRIQLREQIHHYITTASHNRCVSPAAFVSMVVYEYLRDRGELGAVTKVIDEPAPKKPARAKTLEEQNAAFDRERIRQEAEGNVWYNGQWVAEEIVEAREAAAAERSRATAEVVAAWQDDEEELDWGGD